MINLDLEYNKLAKYYDKLYNKKDYKKESKYLLLEIISKNKKSSGKELLDVGCGTGNHISYFKKYNYTGVDISKNMLSLARKKYLNIKFYKKDMADFKFNNKYDIITCLFNSITYILTKKKLEKTLINFYNHLKIGGIVIIESSIIKELLPSFKVIRSYENKDILIKRKITSKSSGIYLNLKTEYSIYYKNNYKKKIYNYNSKLRKYNPNYFIDVMKKIGFKVRKKRNKANGYDLFIGIKQ